MTADLHRWLRVYVVEEIPGYPPNHEPDVIEAAHKWNGIFGLREDGRFFYQSYVDEPTFFVAEQMFKPGLQGYLDDQYVERRGYANAGSTWDVFKFETVVFSHAASKAQGGPQRGKPGEMYRREDLEGEEVENAGGHYVQS